MTRKAAVTVTAPHLTARKGVWHYQRRVPRDVAHLDARPFARKTTGISVKADPAGTLRAAAIAATFNTEQEADWSDMLAGRDPEQRKRTVRAVEQAKALHIPYRSADDVAVLDLPNILARTKTLATVEPRFVAEPYIPVPRTHDTVAVIDATLGGAARSGILVSMLADTFFAIKAADYRRKSADQIRVLKNTQRGACTKFIAVNGDMDIGAISNAHAVAFHDYWTKRLIEEKKSGDTANKNIWLMRKMLRVVCKHNNLANPGAFAGIEAFKKEKRKRKAFTAQWVLDNIWAPGALARTNQEVRDLTIVLTETGARPIEICALDRDTIFLDAAIPFIRILPEHQELKTEQSARDVPLVGRALEVMRRNPNGFRRYHLKPGAFCQLLNKHLGKLQTVDAGKKRQTTYCIRHLFKDRLRKAGIDAELRLALMGHDTSDDVSSAISDAPDYGEGFELAEKQAALQKIAFPF